MSITKRDILQEINSLTKFVNEKSREESLKYYKEKGVRQKDTLTWKMHRDVYAKNLNGRLYLIKNLTKDKLEKILEDLINWSYDNKVISSAYDYKIGKNKNSVER